MKDRLSSVDALRGTAALMVLGYHARAISWVGMDAFYHAHPGWSWDPQVWLAWLTTPFRAGLIGVQLLFVISGYCIHRNQARLLAQGQPVRLDLRNYSLRRFFRIYPTYAAALAVDGLVLFALIPWLGSRGLPAPDLGRHSTYVLGMNLLAMQNILAPPYEGVFWSLSIEIHLYVVYPIILWVTRNYGPKRMLQVSLAAGLLHIAASTLLPGGRVPQFFLNLTGFSLYWFTWCVGAYVAEWEFGRAKAIRAPAWLWMGCGALGTGLLIGGIANGRLRDWSAREFGEFFIAVMMGGLLAWSLAAGRRSLWSSAVGRGLAFVGTFSFSLYAIHVPVLAAFTVLTGGKPDSILPTFLAAACAIIVAYGFFNLVERWTLQPPRGLKTTKAVRLAPPVSVMEGELVGAGR